MILKQFENLLTFRINVPDVFENLFEKVDHLTVRSCSTSENEAFRAKHALARDPLARRRRGLPALHAGLDLRAAGSLRAAP